MDPIPKDRRQQDRAYVEPYTTNTFLEFTLSGRTHRCLLLDVSPGGLGMLISHTEKEILQHLRPGARMSMAYTSPEATVPMNFEIRHITEIKRGKFRGHFQVGLCLGPQIK
jgi:PilZ domain